jgi:hypothetical protein
MRTLILFLAVGVSLPIAGQSETEAHSKSAKVPFELLISAKPIAALGSPVEVRVRLTNTSTLDINGSTANIKGFGLAYTYEVRDQSGKKLEQKQIDVTHQASAQVFTLKPGESRGDLTRLNEVYDLSPGKYTLQLSKPLSDEPGAQVVKSNKIMVTVTP